MLPQRWRGSLVSQYLRPLCTFSGGAMNPGSRNLFSGRCCNVNCAIMQTLPSVHDVETPDPRRVRQPLVRRIPGKAR